MNPFVKQYGSWALIAGAAEGLGKSFSKALAGRGIHLVMVDRQEDALYALAGELESSCKIETRRIVTDLASADAAASIMQAVSGLDCRLFVYIAAYSRISAFAELKEEDINRFIDVNCRSQALLLHGFARHLMRSGHGGGIITLSSLAGLIGTGLAAPYAASKAFTWNLSEALSAEWKEYGIHVLTCLAGATATPTYLASHPKYGLIQPPILDPDRVASATLKKLGRTTMYIPGLSNRINYFILTRLLPRKWAAYLVNRAMQNMYRN
jgi:short-subunit dehydrogenase